MSKTVFQIQKSNQRIGSETVLVGHLKLPVLARYLRINPNNFRKDGSIRVEVFGCHMTDNRNKRKYKQWRVSSYSPGSPGRRKRKEKPFQLFSRFIWVWRLVYIWTEGLTNQSILSKKNGFSLTQNPTNESHVRQPLRILVIRTQRFYQKKEFWSLTCAVAFVSLK